MKHYQHHGNHLKLVCTLNGSVFPKAAKFALPSTLIAIAVKIAQQYLMADAEGEEALRSMNSAVYSGFSFVVGFLLVFRTSQAYGRYTEGSESLHFMRIEWFDACSTLIAFSHQANKTHKARAKDLRHLLVRLFSLLHSIALQEIEDLRDEEFELIDINGIDRESIQYLRDCSNRGLYKVDVVFQWLQCCMTENIYTGLLPVPAPILTRVYQELSTGMCHFNNAYKVKDTPFPFPYAQMITLALLMHMTVTPVVMSMWTHHWVWSGIFTFVPVFCFWCINYIAEEIEHPFGDDVNDLAVKDLQMEMNKMLIVLLEDKSCRVPRLSNKAIKKVNQLRSQGRASHSLNMASALSRSSRSSRNVLEQDAGDDDVEEPDEEEEEMQPEPQPDPNPDPSLGASLTPTSQVPENLMALSHDLLEQMRRSAACMEHLDARVEAMHSGVMRELTTIAKLATQVVDDYSSRERGQSTLRETSERSRYVPQPATAKKSTFTCCAPATARFGTEQIPANQVPVAELIARQQALQDFTPQVQQDLSKMWPPPAGTGLAS